MNLNYRQGKGSGMIVRVLGMLAAVVMSAGVVIPVQAQTYPVAFPEPTTFLSAPAPDTTSSTTAVAIGDFNGDGKLDTVNIDSGSRINVMLGKGDGTFEAPVTTLIAAANFFPEAIAVGDFNGDHVLDVAVWAANSTTGNTQVNIYLGTGTGTFTAGATYTAPSSNNFNPGPNSIVAEDVNGDGKLDLVAMTPYNGVFVFPGNGDGTFQTPVVNTTVCTNTIGNCESLAVGDLNGDGKPDLAVQSNDTVGGGMSILLNNGSGTFGTGTYYPVAISGVYANGGIAIGDVNGDKKPDVVVASSSVTAIVYLNQGSGTFKVNGTVGSVPVNPTNNVVLVDINNDKKLDIVVPDGHGDVLTFYGKGNGTFSDGPVYPLQAPNNSGDYLVAIGDFNGDGTPDLLDTNGLNTNSVSLGRGDGSFQTNQAYNYNTNLVAGNIATADFNGDGFPDIVQPIGGVVNGTSTNGKIGINLGSSHGVPGTTSVVTVSTCANNIVEWVATGDVNGDGKADIVAAMQDASFAGCQNNTVAVLEGLGTGKFKASAYYPTGSTTQEQTIYLVDMNGDGKLDIVTGNADGSISVLLNKGNGTYDPGTLNTSLTSVFTSGIALTFADFNGDGKMDIAVSASINSPGVVYVLPGNGNGTFGIPIETALPYSPTKLVAADFNKDGKADLLVAGQFPGCGSYALTYAFLEGAGNGTFTAGPIECWSAGTPGNPVAVDLNGDGNLDVVIPYDGAPGSPAILQGKGDGTFTGSQYFYTGQAAISAVVADFNGDGMPDVALVNSSTFNPEFLTMMFNSTQPVSVSPLLVNFGAITVGASKAETIVLTNDQSTALAIASITLGGTDPSDFTAKSNCGTSRLPGHDCTITVTAKPTVAGAQTATLTIKDGAGTQTVQLVIDNPVPVITSLSPNTAIAGGAGFTLTVTGKNFVSTSVVKWAGSARATTFVSATELTATILATDIAKGGTFAVTVNSPAPGGGTSGASNFVVDNPVPTLTSISPSSATHGGAAFTLTATGTNYVVGSVIEWKGVKLTTTHVSSTTLTATVPSTDIKTAGTAAVTVVNSTPGGGTSAAQTFTIN
jgi:hypothetical protein